MRTPADAFCQMAACAATALDIEGGDFIHLVAWDEWLALPVREHDTAVRTVRGLVRVPTVVVAVNFAKVPKKRPSLRKVHPRARRQSLPIHRPPVAPGGKWKLFLR
ncbi:MAG: hypothetical protein FJ386_14735 [Verrucomicrobia bacterium]|nr:hypothetical protein [Verrucomicrobiota bacterium]